MEVDERNVPPPPLPAVVASPLLSEVVRGYNAALLCYGQTGTGKAWAALARPPTYGVGNSVLSTPTWNQQYGRYSFVCLNFYG